VSLDRLILLREELQYLLSSKELLKFYKAFVDIELKKAHLGARVMPDSILGLLARERILGADEILNPFVELFESTLRNITASIELKNKNKDNPK